MISPQAPHPIPAQMAHPRSHMGSAPICLASITALFTRVKPPFLWLWKQKPNHYPPPFLLTYSTLLSCQPKSDHVASLSKTCSGSQCQDKMYSRTFVHWALPTSPASWLTSLCLGKSGHLPGLVLSVGMITLLPSSEGEEADACEVPSRPPGA